MKPIERIQALLDGKKIRRTDYGGREFVYLEDTKIIPSWNTALLTQTNVISSLLDRDLKWELYEEPEPEIKLTPEMVGKTVRLANQDLCILTTYRKATGYFLIHHDGGMFKYDKDGTTTYGNYPIIEVLER